MMTSIRRFGWLALALVALIGCDSSPEKAPAPPGPPSEPKKAADSGKLTAEEIAEIKKLPEAEQTIALAQVTCPVSGAHLGAMDLPIKQTIGDKSFYICCDGCKDEIKSNPQGVLAKLKK